MLLFVENVKLTNLQFGMIYKNLNKLQFMFQ